MHALALLVLSYVFVPAASNMMTANIDLDRALEIRHRYGSHFIWVEREGREYVIRDSATLDAIDRLFEEAHAVSPELERLHAKMRPLEKRQERLEAEADAISDDDSRSARDDARLRDIERELHDVEGQLRDFEREEERIERKQDRMEEQAEERMTPILEDAIRRGIAKSR